MKKGWLIPLILVLVIGIMGFGLTEEEAQKVQKMNRKAVRTQNLGCEVSLFNPLREEAYSEVARTVKEYYRQLGNDRSFIESYNNIRVFTKKGRYTDSYIVFVKYEMGIKDIYTKVPGLGTLYVEKNGTSGRYEIKNAPEEKDFEEYISVLSSHEDVQELLAGTNKEYEAAVDSDALLREALLDLKNAYEDQTVDG